jgi:hypothetical protein
MGSGDARHQIISRLRRLLLKTLCFLPPPPPIHHPLPLNFWKTFLRDSLKFWPKNNTFETFREKHNALSLRKYVRVSLPKTFFTKMIRIFPSNIYCSFPPNIYVAEASYKIWIRVHPRNPWLLLLVHVSSRQFHLLVYNADNIWKLEGRKYFFHQRRVYSATNTNITLRRRHRYYSATNKDITLTPTQI